MLIQNINIYNFFSFFFKRAFTQKPEGVLKKKEKKTWNLTQFIPTERQRSDEESFSIYQKISRHSSFFVIPAK
jgi:hypothetical protein